MLKTKWTSLFPVLSVAVVLATSAHSYAQGENKPAETAPPAKTNKSDRMDLENLEKKYWAAKDTDFTVVQNRTYTKDGKVFISLSSGTLVNDAYSFGRMSNFALGYYFSERFGLEVSREWGKLSDNDSIAALVNNYGAKPDYNTFNQYTSVNFLIVPFYAKMSFFDQVIMYFDMQFGFGVGQMQYTVQQQTFENVRKTTSGYNFDFTQNLFFAKNWSLRLDIKNKWSKHEIFQYNSGVTATEPRKLQDKNQQDTSFLLGLTYFF